MINKLHYRDKFLRTALIVDDEEINRELLGGILEDQCNIIYAENGLEALITVQTRKETISIVLLDLMMPEMDGFEVIRRMQADPELRRIPFIVLTSQSDAEVESLNLGAMDFITKPYDMPEIIISRVNRMMELYEDRSIIQSAERDNLTNLFTKTFFYEYCSIMDNYHPEKDMDALYINIDRFKLINEIYGKDFADDVLKALSDVIGDFSHKNEGIAGRGQYDDFYMYLNHQKDYSSLEKNIEKHITEAFKSNNIHIRIGIFLKKSGDEDIAGAFDRAETACNTIRGKYHQNIAYFDQALQMKTFQQERLIHDIKKALSEEEFMAYFQPKYDITGEKPVLSGAEALVRWKHAELGVISPASFISLFEANGLIHLVDRFMWREAASQIKKWKDKFGYCVPISVNVSRIDFYNPSMESELCGLIEEFGLSESDLHLEITESCYSEDPKQLLQTVKRLRNRGFVIELDDFGSGYSSLSILSTLPIDILKIDMSFIRSMYDDPKNMRMLEIIIDIAKNLNVPVTAEGVETQQQYDDLKKMSCNNIQGYLFSKPVPAKEFEKFLLTQKMQK